MTPFDRVIWSAEQCAEYLEQSVDTFLSETQHAEGFPSRLARLEKPMWRALDVSKYQKGIPNRKHVNKGKTTIYRHFDRFGQLLYIGRSVSLAARLIQHGKESPWFADIASITLQHFDTLDEALEAERKAIKEENPFFNIIHSNINEKISRKSLGR